MLRFVLNMMLIMGITMVSTCTFAQKGAWIVSEKDHTLSDTLERWTQQEGRHTVWEASVQYRIADADSLNQAAKLTYVTSLKEGVERLLNTVENRVPLSEQTLDSELPLTVCYFEKGDIAMVVRSIQQPDCNHPLKIAR